MKARHLFDRSALVVALILAAGCSAGSVTLPGRTAVSSTETPAPTETIAAPPTVTPTETTIPTAVPMVTPSPGPAPDLELLNIDFKEDYDGINILGEIHNNTDQPMIFPGGEYGLSLDIDRWSDAYSMGYHHLIQNIFILPNDEHMNCILYPGEMGIVADNISTICGDLGDINDCKTKLSEFLPNPPSQLGYQLTGYKGIYRRWEDLRGLFPFTRNKYPAELDKRYHPQAENLTYNIQGSEIIIAFDMEIYLPSYIGLPHKPSWVILYDAGGRIINVLYTNLYFEKIATQYFESGRYHIYGVGSNDRTRKWETPEIDNQWWKPVVDLTSDDLLRVDHIRVINEIADVNMCYNPIYWDNK